MEPPKFRFEDALAKTSYFQDNLENLLSYLQPSFYCLKLIVKVLLHGPDGSGKRMLAQLAAKNLSMTFCEERVADLFDENIVGTEKKVRSAISKFGTSAPCLIYLSGYELLCKLEEPDLDRIEHSISESIENLLLNEKSQPIVFIASTNDFQQVYHSPLFHIFQHDNQLRSPTLTQAEELVEAIKAGAGLQSSVDNLSTFCENGDYYLGNLIDLVARAEVGLHDDKEMPTPHEAKEGINSVRWSDIGGLKNVKQEIIDAIQLSLDYPQLKQSGLRRTGILLHGPPGTGKTLLAKAVATECSLKFINVKGPELLNEYVGQSEDNIRKLFHRARESSPSVIFFDEIDSLAPNRGQSGDSGGVMDRMVSQLLAEMDSVGKSEGVFVIGATNRVDLVDPSLLRPGRFDKVVEVALPVSKENRLQILKALTRKMNLDQNITLDRLESLIPPKVSGADIQGFCSRAMQKTFDRCVGLVESGQVSETDVEMVTTEEDFLGVFLEE